MSRFSRILICISFVLICASCGHIDSGHPWEDGDYALQWIDEPNQVALSFNRGQGSWTVLIDAQVYSVGSNTNFIVAKQHPHGDRSILQLWIIDKTKPPEKAAIGPFSQEEYNQQAKRLSLPEFSKTLASL